MKEINVLLVGFGQLGKLLLKLWAVQPGFRVIGVVDSDPALEGCNAAELAGIAGMDLPIRKSAAGFGGRAEVAVVTTVSTAETIMPLLQSLLKEGLSVVTSCEELFYPFRRYADEIRSLAALAEKQNLAVLAAGINPGFLMDVLPVTLSGASALIESVTIDRVQDASPRRMQFQKKIGAGLDLDEFEKRAESGVLRHVGITESLFYVADSLGWKLASVDEELSPVIAEKDLAIPGAIPVKAGQARGVRQTGIGKLADGTEVIRLNFLAAVGEGESYDRIVIDGVPRLESTIKGGVNGDQGSCAVLTSAVRRLQSSSLTGFLTMRDLPQAPGAVRRDV